MDGAPGWGASNWATAHREPSAAGWMDVKSGEVEANRLPGSRGGRSSKKQAYNLPVLTYASAGSER